MQQIRDCYFFKGYSDSQLEEVIRLAREQSFEEGSFIIEADKTNDSLYILIEGKAVVQDRLLQGIDIDLHRVRFGELFGEYTFVDPAPASANVVAKSLVRTLRFSFVSLREFFKRHPECELYSYRLLASNMSRRLRRANLEIRRSFLASLGWDEALAEEQASETLKRP